MHGRMLTSAALLLRALFAPWHSGLTCCIGLDRHYPRLVHEQSKIQTQGAWYSSIDERQTVCLSGTSAWQIITLREKKGRKPCSVSMLRQHTVRHEPSNILYIF